MADNPFHHAMLRLLGARPAEDFLGRAPDLERLAALAEKAATGAESAVALEGPHGSGKSELLRQLTLNLGVSSGACLPIYLDLPSFFIAGPLAGVAGEGRMREALFRSLLRQALIGTGSLDPADLQWLEADPSRLAGFLYGAGLGGLAPLVSEPARHLSFVEAWRALLGAWRGYALPPLLLILDGAAGGPDRAIAATLGLILESARRESCPAFFEAPDEADTLLTPTLESVERFALTPLRPPDALALACRIGQARGWSLPANCIEPVLERLGPWPGWVRGWALRVRPPAAGLSPVRVAEEAYVDFLGSGAWAEGLRRRFERLVTISYRESSLRLLRYTLDRDQLVNPHEASALLGLGERESERVLAALTHLGLLGRQGARWGAPRAQALADWVRLTLAEQPRDATPAAVRMSLLGRLLTQPRPATEGTPSSPVVERLLPELLQHFQGQLLPPVLLHFGDYHEALGKMPPEKRFEAVRRSTAILRLPETIGVAEWRPTPAGGVRPPAIFYGRAYREGKYQRSHEEVWIAIDLSATRMLTTPEVVTALQWVESLEASLHPNRFTRWVILGEGASAEALELIKSKGCFCSGREQLTLIQEMISNPPPRQARPAPGPSAAPASTPSPVVRHTVIDLRVPDAEPRVEASSLRLPAREGSELIAALTAEKIALRADFESAPAGQIKTAVLEGVLNAIEHSPNVEKAIDIQFQLTPEALEVLIENEGPAFDPLAVPTPDPQAKLSSPHKRGWGLSLMKRFMDEIGYEPCARGTRLRLIKRRPRPQAAPAEGSLRGTD